MRHLNYVIAFTGRFDTMRRFYERGLGLPVRRAEPDWVEFDNAGAAFALHHMDDPARQGLTLRFVTANLEEALADLRGRGLAPDGEVIDFRGGRLAQFWDADDNLLTLLEPATPAPSGAGEPISPLILNVADMRAAVAFYRDRFGIRVPLESESWTELDTGATRVVLHPRGPAARGLRHNDQAIVMGFEVPSLEELGRELAERGLVYSGGPVDERHGRFAEVLDPDGRVVLFRQAAASSVWGPDEDDEVEPFEDAPTHAAMRKPASNKAKATSRVVVKPVYRRKKSGRAAKSKHPAKSATVRTNTRLKAKPPTGRLKKAERRSAVRKKAAIAAASRGKPVKRAGAGRAGRKSAAARRGGTKRAKAKRSSARRAR